MHINDCTLWSTVSFATNGHSIHTLIVEFFSENNAQQIAERICGHHSLLSLCTTAANYLDPNTHLIQLAHHCMCTQHKTCFKGLDVAKVSTTL